MSLSSPPRPARDAASRNRPVHAFSQARRRAASMAHVSTGTNSSPSFPLAPSLASLSTSAKALSPYRGPLSNCQSAAPLDLDPLDQEATTAIDQSLRSFRLFQALRLGDSEAVLNLLNAFPDSSPGPLSAPVKRSASQPNHHREYLLTPLHLAVRCAKLPVVQLVLSNCPPHFLITQDQSGQTPLHVACALGRFDVVSLFLSLPQVDDSIRDRDSRTCLEVCQSADVARLIQASRAQLNATYLALLSAYIASSPTVTVSKSLVTADSRSYPLSPTGAFDELGGHLSAVDQLYQFILRPRSKSIDLNLKEEQSGATILHEAARRKDTSLIQLAINRGADVLAKDRRNRMPIDVTADERVKNLLRKAAATEGRALKAVSQASNWHSDHPVTASLGAMPNHTGTAPPVSIQLPTLKGYLSKWTNMARGYGTRWLVLENGYLSYYRDQKDEGKALRGSIAMSVAVVAGPDVTKNKLTFEVSSKLGSSYPRFYLKGAHPLEVMRWVDALHQAIECVGQANSQSNKPLAHQSSSCPSAEHEKLGFVSRHIKNPRAAHSRLNSTKRVSAVALSVPSVPFRFGNQVDPDSPQGSTFAHSFTDDESCQPGSPTPQRENELELLGHALKTHIDMTRQLIDSLTTSTCQPLPRSPSLSSARDVTCPASHLSDPTHSPPTCHVASPRQIEVKQALKRSMEDISGMVDEYLAQALKREKFHVRRYEEELMAKKLWEENMQNLVTSHTAIEQQLQTVSRDSSKWKKQFKHLKAARSETSVVSNVVANATLDADRDKVADGLPSHTSEGHARQTNGPPQPVTVGDVSADDSSGSSDSEDDEFFEAIETGTISFEPMAVTKPDARNLPFVTEVDISSTVDGYEVKRTTLPITADDRPAVSLWGILKNSIGKDLTKISFPVSFNEPVSMLQRMAEDMQFSECLDAAAEQPESLARLAYVAGFAMSNYSSTVNRLAKPFNPLLGETFEYVDPAKMYRYLSEQISHHPPMSACLAESPRWRYWGETDAKNKFTGKSFEIRPTGIAHAVLYVPKEFSGAENYPQALTDPARGEEHYSWKKVTTVVSNFILGTPSIDHYGDMEITSHRTGERCVLTFKPRGWRGKDANEVRGMVYDRHGKLAWELAGKWTTQLIARRVGSAGGELASDQKVPSSTPTGDGAAKSRECLQLWKNDVRPPNIPFSLTRFAVTLNAINDRLKIWLPPTDCRLRPDQHAFERGAWEKANELKSALEDHQRMTRRKREIGELPQHAPRWFKPVEDEDTGERTWDAVRLGDEPREGNSGDGTLEALSPDNFRVAYWEERKRVGLERQKGHNVEWQGVDHIFGDFELLEG